MKKLQKISQYIGLLFFLFVYFVSPTPLFAVACTGLPSIGDLSLSNCILTVAGTTGSDQASNTEGSTTNTANLLLSTGASVTINATGILAVGSISPQGGSVAIENGGQIKLNTPLYIPDADADGWASDFSTVYTATSSGRRRLSLMRSAATADCGDSTYATNNVCCTAATRYQDADGDTYGNPSVSISACTTAGYVDNNTDCNDASASLFRSVAGYLDNDGDGYGAGAYTTCAGASGTYRASGADCYEGNASAYPGSGVCSGGNRGDGSFDWNCDGGQSGCGTAYYNAYAAGTLWIVDENNCGVNMAGEPKCCAGGTQTCLSSQVGCGGGGYALGAWWSSCTTCGCNTSCYAPGGYGVQACQ